ncbi:carbohydrate binding domain-containing protein [Flammeovirga sp. SubArs3]|uniref:carbohydrate binding domain-containing protein n=1 Tax=Flammeovirga sp. SubArs3 TaxID=2995316 RepID=UPI00248CF0A4|nr:carbohydrate binding domain-containing protein [Flammeovirga sp. SubArs3]
MKTLFTLVVTLFFSAALMAQDWKYIPIKGTTNAGFEKQSGPVKPISTLPGKGKKGVEGWYLPFTGSLVKESIVVTNKEAYNGDYSLQIKTNPNASVLYKGLLKHNPIKIKSPGRYKISFWVKASDTNAKIKIGSMISKDALEQTLKMNKQGKPFNLGDTKPKVVDLTLSKDWKQISRQVVVTKKDIEAGYEYIIPTLLMGGTPNVTFYIDEFRLEYVMKSTSK